MFEKVLLALTLAAAIAIAVAPNVEMPKIEKASRA